jgi:DNA-binding transcriptional ArsR family regulator
MQLDVFQVIADPMRRRILASLQGGERQVNDVVKELDIHQSGVSRHLRILHESGFVQVRADGQKRLYSLCAEPFKDLDAWLLGYRELWEARLDRFERALKKKQQAHKQNPKKTELS